MALISAMSVCAQTNEEEINSVVDGKREGFWRIEGSNGKVEEGNYVDGKKNGIWKTTKAGVVQSEVTFTNDKAVGEATIYFPDGRIMEKGYWNIDHWEGSYDRFHENGNKACQFTYDNRGRRQGRQLYFHENGKIMYDGEWKSGKIIGTLSVFNEDGNKILERNYSETGKFEGNTEVAIDVTSRTIQEFTGTGNYTLYHVNGKVDRKGYFLKGKLINGEKYNYNGQWKVTSIDTYQEGVITNSKKK